MLYIKFIHRNDGRVLEARLGLASLNPKLAKHRAFLYRAESLYNLLVIFFAFFCHFWHIFVLFDIFWAHFSLIARIRTRLEARPKPLGSARLLCELFWPARPPLIHRASHTKATNRPTFMGPAVQHKHTHKLLISNHDFYPVDTFSHSSFFWSTIVKIILDRFR